MRRQLLVMAVLLPVPLILVRFAVFSAAGPALGAADVSPPPPSPSPTPVTTQQVDISVMTTLTLQKGYACRESI